MGEIDYNYTTMEGVNKEITDSLTEIDSILSEFEKKVNEASTDWDGDSKVELYKKIAETTALIPTINERSNGIRTFLGSLGGTYSNLDMSLIIPANTENTTSINKGEV